MTFAGRCVMPIFRATATRLAPFVTQKAPLSSRSTPIAELPKYLD